MSEHLGQVDEVVDATEPLAEAVSLAELKAHARIDTDVDDVLLASLILTARQLFERETQRNLVKHDVTWRLSRFPSSGGELGLPRGPVETAPATLAYRDEDGAGQTLTLDTDYTLELLEPGRIVLAPDKTWPAVFPQPGSVSLTWSAGYEDAATVPQLYKHALLMLVGGWYEVREEAAPGARIRAAPRALAAERIMQQATLRVAI